MKKLWILFLAAGLVMACNNDKNGKDKNKTAIDNREKDDYRKTGKKDGKTTREDNSTTSGSDGKTSATDQGHDGWGDSKNTADWSDAEKSQFMNDCERTASKNVGAARANEYCDCMLQKLMKQYSSYSQANRELDEPGSQEMLDSMVARCNRQ